MIARRLLWLRVVPLAAAGVLGGHDVAYRLVGPGPVGVHAYLAHAPQILLALLLPAALVSLRSSGGHVRPGAFALIGVGGFALMEHLERLAHGQLPWLLTTPVFLLGLGLQLPFALLAWWLARILLVPALGARRRPPAAARLPLLPAEPALALAPPPPREARRPRGPPILL